MTSSLVTDRVRVGIIGCGAISANYLQNARSFPILDIRALSDLNLDAARSRAAEFGIPQVLSVEALLADPEIELVLNLTVPKAHAPVALRILEAGKHTYHEKPFGLTREEGRQILDAAGSRGLRVGCAPDTVLGAGIQTARRVVDEGRIGQPVAFTAFMMGRGPEGWHPNPEFYYEPGGGPMLDMGPYYLTALLNLLGPVKRISGMASIAIPVRTIGSEPKRGKQIHVETPDHVTGLLEFESGCVGTIITSFATRFPQHDPKLPITLHGTDGTLRVPDPNHFDGEVQLRREGEEEWTVVPPTSPTGYGRSVGLADMAEALRSGRPHRCSAEQAFTVLDLMQGFLESSETGQTYSPVTRYDRPAPMPDGLPFGVLES